VPDVFEQYPVASWQAVGENRLEFAVLSVREHGGTRAAENDRPFRGGTKVDPLGVKARTFAVEALFSNDIREPGVPEDPAPYPHQLNRLLDVLTGQIGKLILPTRGEIRALLKDYDRSETSATRDEARITLNFVEDNDDSVDASAFALPAVRASLNRLASDTTFTSESSGIGLDDLLEQLENFADDLNGAINAPGDLIDETLNKANRVIHTAERVEREFSDEVERARSGLTEPENHRSARMLRRLRDAAGRAVGEQRRSRPKTRVVRFDRERSLYGIATELGQDPNELLDMNYHLPDPLAIESGRGVRVFA
jgi:prophage DNA circulation protein